MSEYGLVGERLSHSFSPEIHGRLGDYKYELIEVPKDKIDAFFEAREFKGLNVTIPYKETVILHLDEIDDAAREIGAVNTVVNRDGKLIGYNTDCYGMRCAILRAGIEITGKKVLICGTGGTSKTAAYVARELGAKEVVFLSRSGRSSVTYEDAYREHTDAEVIINTTPCGMFPDNFSSPVDLSRFPSLTGVFDAVFNPLRTSLVLDAAALGVKCSGGLYMLVAQAARASEIFKGVTCSKGAADKIFTDLVKEKENVVLIGMPSSGKSTVGKEVAKALGREFIDLDDEIVKADGRPITEIFSSDGEEYFRDAESRAVKASSARQGVVIATGGGAVLRTENVRALRQNGKIFFLDRSPDNLTATSDRPLSNSKEAIEIVYRTRIDVYRAVCDARVDSNGTVAEAAKEIINEFI